jgi:hypothetical protein
MSVRIFPRPLGGVLTTLLQLLTAHSSVLSQQHRAEIHNDMLRAGKYDDVPRRSAPWAYLLR